MRGRVGWVGCGSEMGTRGMIDDGQWEDKSDGQGKWPMLLNLEWGITTIYIHM